jgi:hypothetical protein
MNKFYKMSYSRYQYLRGELEDLAGEPVLPVPSQYIVLDGFVYFGLMERFWNEMNPDDEITREEYDEAVNIKYPPEEILIQKTP